MTSNERVTQDLDSSKDRELITNWRSLSHHWGLYYEGLLFLFRATPVANESSQARGWIREAVGLHDSHSNTRSELHLCLCCNLWQHQILSPLSDARNQTCNLMDTSWVLNPPNHNRNTKNLKLSEKPPWNCCVVTIDSVPFRGQRPCAMC